MSGMMRDGKHRTRLARPNSQAQTGTREILTFLVRLTTGRIGNLTRLTHILLFKNAQGFGRLEAGSRAGFTSSRPPPPWTSVQ